MRKITKIEPVSPTITPKKRVAAYARVSKDSVRSMHSISQQVSYYSRLIQANSDWIYAGVYTDDGISGKSTKHRPQFQRMISECKAGQIDLVLTKSISRFARNTLDLLRIVRRLKEIGVEVWFQEENIHSLSSDGELMLTILASYAQAELETVSTNIKWVVHKKFERGVLNGVRPFLGYRWDKGEEKLKVIPEEAAIVREIFGLCIDGHPTKEIARILNQEGTSTVGGGRWLNVSVRSVLQNISYTGNLLLQKTYAEDPLSKRKANSGERPQFFVQDSHDAIVSMEDYEKAQAMLQHLREEGNYTVLNKYPFSQLITCGICGKHYRRATQSTKYGKTHNWACQTKENKGADACGGKRIPEAELYRISCEVLGMEVFDEVLFSSLVKGITVIGNDQLDFHLADGSVVSRKWKTGLYSKEGRERAKHYYDPGKA